MMNKSYDNKVVINNKLVMDYSTLFEWKTDLDMKQVEEVYWVCDQSNRWKNPLSGKVLIIQCMSVCEQVMFKSLIAKNLPLKYDTLWMTQLSNPCISKRYDEILVVLDGGKHLTELRLERIKQIKSHIVENGVVYFFVWAKNHVQQFAELLYEYGEMVEGLKGSENLKRQLRCHFKEVDCEHIEWELEFTQAEGIISEMVLIYADILLRPSFDLEQFKLFIVNYLMENGSLVVDMHYKVYKCIHREGSY